MNHFNLKLDFIRGADRVEYEGIVFSNCAFISLLVDGVNPMTKSDDRNGVIVWDQIKKTKHNSGKFLILTCVCGIADDAGFKLVDVTRNENSVTWEINDDTNWTWKFALKNYDAEINRIEQELKILGKQLKLEPDMVVFPE